MTSKAFPPIEMVNLTPEHFVILWITQLQTEITHQTDADKAYFLVMGYGGTESVWTEIDIYTDDPTNAFDGTWTALQIWR